jgi:hypothetical protein
MINNMTLKNLVKFAMTAKSSTVNNFAFIAVKFFVSFAVMGFEIVRTFGVVMHHAFPGTLSSTSMTLP